MIDILSAPFSIPDARHILRAVRLSLAVILLVWIAIGPFPSFYPDEEVLLYAPTGVVGFLPPLGATAFHCLKIAVVLGCFGMMFRRTSLLATQITALTFGVLNGYVAGFSPIWNYNTHLNTFLVALAFAPKEGLNAPSHSEPHMFVSDGRSSAILFFMRTQVAVIYLQAGLAKVVHGGFAWPFHTPHLHLVLQGGWAAPWLTSSPDLVVTLGYLVVLAELLLPALFLMRRTQRLAVAIAVAMHFSFYFGLGISFWHLWVLFPALFLIRSTPSTIIEKKQQPV